MEEDLSNGKAWVVGVVEGEAQKLNLKLTLQWGDQSPYPKYQEAAFNLGYHLLITLAEKTDDSLVFTREELAFCPTDPKVQAMLRSKVSTALLRLKTEGSKRHIGV